MFWVALYRDKIGRLRNLHRLACVTHAPLFCESEPPPLTVAQMPLPKSRRLSPSIILVNSRTPCWKHDPMVFPDPGTVVADFVLQAFSRNYLGGCNPGVDAHIIITAGTKPAPPCGTAH
jgi:hypothetical protein